MNQGTSSFASGLILRAISNVFCCRRVSVASLSTGGGSLVCGQGRNKTGSATLSDAHLPLAGHSSLVVYRHLTTFNLSSIRRQVWHFRFTGDKQRSARNRSTSAWSSSCCCVKLLKVLPSAALSSVCSQLLQGEARFFIQVEQGSLTKTKTKFIFVN